MHVLIIHIKLIKHSFYANGFHIKCLRWDLHIITWNGYSKSDNIVLKLEYKSHFYDFFCNMKYLLLLYLFIFNIIKIHWVESYSCCIIFTHFGDLKKTETHKQAKQKTRAKEQKQTNKTKQTHKQKQNNDSWQLFSCFSIIFVFLIVRLIVQCAVLVRTGCILEIWIDKIITSQWLKLWLQRHYSDSHDDESSWAENAKVLSQIFT